jgi:hypothetical protein
MLAGMSAPKRALWIRRVWNPLGIAVTVAVATCCLLGLYLWTGNIFLPWYFPAVSAHIWLGLGSLVLGTPVLVYHARSSGRAGRAALGISSFALLGVWLGLDPDWLLWAKPVGRAAVTAALPLAVVLGAVSLVRSEKGRPFSILGALLMISLAFTITTGVQCWTYRGEGRFHLSDAHGWAALVTTLLLLCHVPPFKYWTPQRFRVPAVLLIPGLVFALLAILNPPWLLREFPEVSGGSGFTPATSAERAAGGLGFSADSYMASATCGEVGCHPTLTKQWEGSAHRFSADNDLFRKVVALLVSEAGSEIAIFCANCHDPLRVLTSEVASAYANGAPPPGDGVGCLVCHSSIALKPSALHNGVLGYREPIRYPGRDEETRMARIRLDPRFHREQMTPDQFMSDSRNCGPCHRVVLGPDLGLPHAVLQAPYEPGMFEELIGDEHEDSYALYEGEPQLCIECHVLATTTEEGRHDILYDHHFAGINLELPLYARHPDADVEALAMVRDRVQRLLDGTIEFDPALYPDSGPDRIAHARMQKFLRTSGVVELEVDGRRTDDGGLEIVTTTTNHRAAHPFPVGPMDLQQVWQEVVVRDAAGSVLGHVGALDDRERIDPQAHRLGGVELGSDGAPLRQHRVWTVTAVVDERKVPRGESVTDTYSFTIPSAAPGPVWVEVSWNLRRAGPEFTQWVYGNSDQNFPVHRIAHTSLEVGD